jgi:hypothetical protein
VSDWKKKAGKDGDPITWDDIWRIGLGLLGYNKQELGVLTPRLFFNATQGYLQKRREAWEQARLIAYYSAFDRKPFKLTDIYIPVAEDEYSEKTSDQNNKEEAYKILEKWNK